MRSFYKSFKQMIKRRFVSLASFIDQRAKGAIRPADITWAGLVGHLPVAYFISQGQLFLAGLLLIFFGLFDTFDGALARVQKTESERGMFLDASVDRIKEVLLYSAFAVYFINVSPPWGAVASVVACGLSLSVSYVKAKGEAALAIKSGNIPHQKLNRMFGEGVGAFEIRMSLLVLGCLAGIPEWTIMAIILLSAVTVITRFNAIIRTL